VVATAAPCSDRLARGTLTPRRQLIDLGALVHRVVEDAGVRDEHPVVVDAPPLRLAADAPKLERILENLLVNAAKHTPAGTTIWVRLHAQDVEGPPSGSSSPTPSTQTSPAPEPHPPLRDPR
jgi:signal transduction histidine kinase